MFQTRNSTQFVKLWCFTVTTQCHTHCHYVPCEIYPFANWTIILQSTIYNSNTDMEGSAYKSVYKLVKILYQYLLQQVKIRDHKKRSHAKVQPTEDSRREKSVWATTYCINTRWYPHTSTLVSRASTYPPCYEYYAIAEGRGWLTRLPAPCVQIRMHD